MPSQLPALTNLNDFVRGYGKTGLFVPKKHADIDVGDIVLCREKGSGAEPTMLGKVVYVGRQKLVGKAKEQDGKFGDALVLPYNKSRINNNKPFNGNLCLLCLHFSLLAACFCCCLCLLCLLCLLSCAFLEFGTILVANPNMLSSSCCFCRTTRLVATKRAVRPPDS